MLLYDSIQLQISIWYHFRLKKCSANQIFDKKKQLSHFSREI